MGSVTPNMSSVMRACGVMCFVRSDTGKSRASPRQSPSPAVDRYSPRDRPTSARGQQHTASPVRCPGSGKYGPASGKSSPVASPLIDSSRRRRSADRQNSPRHAASSAVCGPSSSMGGLGCEKGFRDQVSANRHPVRCNGVQSASSLPGPMTDSRVKPTAVVQQAAIHSATHVAVPAGGSEVRLPRRADVQSNVDDKNGNSQRPFTANVTTTTTTTTTATVTATTAAAAAAAADDDDRKFRRQYCTQQSLPAIDANSTSQVNVSYLKALLKHW